MAGDPKAKLYHQVVQRVPNDRLLDLMRRHGFWPERQPLPPDPADEAAERAALQNELAQLQRMQIKVKNIDKALAEERKRRWDESKKRRAERKKEKEAALARRRAEWDEFRRTTIVHVGASVSCGLEGIESNGDELDRRGLPWMHTAADLATHLDISIPALHWLTYHRNAAAVVHYHRYSIPKKSGGVRCISAPKTALATAQRWVFDNILAKLEVEATAHGFVPGRSIVSNAEPHAGKAIVINVDLTDFFPSITFRRVKGLFAKLGYSEHVATLLALLCTEPPRVATEFDGKVYHVSLGSRRLPQGACTSPAITNALCRRLDRRLAGLAKRHGFTYTRYADDLTLSGGDAKAVGKLLKSVRSIIAAEGFAEHPRKTRVMRQSNRQEVTGVTVNVRPTLDRRELRELRAILHNAARHGLASQNRDARPDFAAYLKGRVAFACMVCPKRAPQLRAALALALANRGQ
jgi:retron-type reverse transcriptase